MSSTHLQLFIGNAQVKNDLQACVQAVSNRAARVAQHTDIISALSQQCTNAHIQPAGFNLSLPVSQAPTHAKHGSVCQ